MRATGPVCACACAHARVSVCVCTSPARVCVRVCRVCSRAPAARGCGDLEEERRERMRGSGRREKRERMRGPGRRPRRTCRRSSSSPSSPAPAIPQPQPQPGEPPPHDERLTLPYRLPMMSASRCLIPRSAPVVPPGLSGLTRRPEPRAGPDARPRRAASRRPPDAAVLLEAGPGGGGWGGWVGGPYFK